MSDPKAKRPHDEHEELVQADDAVVGRAFQRSLIALVVILVLGVGAFFALRKKPEPKPTQMTSITAPTAPTRTAQEVPDAKFTDITTAAGINFVHFSGAYGDKLLPETMGGGLAFLDFDNDGDADLLFISGTDWTRWGARRNKRSRSRRDSRTRPTSCCSR